MPGVYSSSVPTSPVVDIYGASKGNGMFGNSSNSSKSFNMWGAVAAAASKVADIATANVTAKRAYKYQSQLIHDQANEQTRLMNHQNDLNVAQWERENAYNSPAQQLERFQAAGLNGGLLMSQGNSLGTGGSTTPSSGGSVSASHADANDALLQRQQAISGLGLDIAQANLLNAQAKKTEKESDLVDTQTSGMKLQNEFDSVRNTLYSKYGELEKRLDLNRLDAQTALADSQRYINKTVEKLNLNELYTMRPEQAAKLVADTAVSQSQEFLNQIVAAKTDEERKLVAKRFLLDQAIAGSTIALNYSNSRAADAQANAWSPNGVMFELNSALGQAQKFKNDNNSILWNMGFTDKQGVYQTFGHYYINSIMNSIQANNLANGLIIKTLGSPSEIRSQLFELYRLFGKGASPYSVPSPFQ